MKIVLVSLHFGEEGSGGARRAFLWAKGLRQAGHQVHVVSPYVEPGSNDDIFIAHSHQKQRDLDAPQKPASLFERLIKRHLRLWLRWPDPEITWYKRVQPEVLKTIQKADWVITTSPPESAHRIGGPLAKSLNAKWCAELRDSWTEDSHRPHVKGLRAFLEKRFAKFWLRSADAVTSVNGYILEEVRALAPQAKFCEIGHFSEPFVGDPAPLAMTDFNLVHAGGFTRSDRRRKLEPLLQNLRPIMAERQNLHLHLFGPLTFDEKETLNQSALKITYHGWVSLSESRALQAAADAVLLYTPESNSLALPGKYSEYCNLRKPIIYLGSETIKNMAHRQAEFLTIESLLDLPKGQITSPEISATTTRATEKLLELMNRTSN